LVDQADIAELKGKMLNRVSIRFKEAVPDLKLSAKGIMDLAGQGISYSFLFRGEIQPLLVELVRFPIEKLTLADTAGCINIAGIRRLRDLQKKRYLYVGNILQRLQMICLLRFLN